MREIQVLDQHTIDKIAAGEVIERPSSVVKELGEIAVDAGATAVTVEIKEGGTTFLRVTDNGSGIERGQVPLAFLRHSTSKIRKAEDLLFVASLGFRGEALSSIAAVSMVELITKTRESESGIRYCIEGGQEKELEEAAAPEGTTFLVRSLFYNTPARRKFLKSPMTEGGYIGDLMERMALSRPDISFRFINNGQTKLHTAGNHNLKDVIYQIYGREIAANLIAVDREQGPIHVTGFIGKPLVGRGNRNFETYFVNGRYVKSTLIAKGIEDAYKTLLMQHKYPFTVLHFAVDGQYLDVNVHPTKMELRFSNQEQVYRFVQETLRDALMGRELIPQVTLGEKERPPKGEMAQEKKTDTAETDPLSEMLHAAGKGGSREDGKTGMPRKPEKEEPVKRTDAAPGQDTSQEWKKAAKSYQLLPPQKQDLDYFLEEMRKRVKKAHEKPVEKENSPKKETPGGNAGNKESAYEDTSGRGAAGIFRESGSYTVTRPPQSQTGPGQSPMVQPKPPLPETVRQEPRQLELFETHLLDPGKKADIRIIGQLFDTYWLVQQEQIFYMIDQHAAHEKVLFEKMMESFKKKEITSQMVSPPLILSLNLAEAEILQLYKDAFSGLGFEVEPFGGREYAISAVPANLFGIAEKELFLEMLDSLSEAITAGKTDSRLVLEKIASMSCKAAVKGNQRLSRQEAERLIETLFTLENPYTCPHGRPTIISMTKQEIERKFKRIV